jgi:hypothetical protein
MHFHRKAQAIFAAAYRVVVEVRDIDYPRFPRAHETISSIVRPIRGRSGLASLVGRKCRNACAHFLADLGFAGGRLPHAGLVP